MICALSISAFAEPHIQKNFSLTFQGCTYTPLIKKSDDVSFATVRFTNIYGSDTITVAICDSNHRPVSETITISEKPDSKYDIEYSQLTYKGNSYCLRICSGNYYTTVSGSWTP